MGETEVRTGVLGQVFAVVFIVLIGFTVVLFALSFPAGFYATFGPGSGPDPWSTSVRPYLWIGPEFVVLPFAATAGAYFIFLNLVYLAFFAYLLALPKSPLKAVSRSLKEGVGAVTSSPFFVSVISISFLIFSATFIDFFASGSGPSTSLLSLTQAPLVEEFGFRLLLIGLIPAILCLGLGWRKVAGVLWKPSSAYAGKTTSDPLRFVVIALLFVSAAIFGLVHIVNGWSFDKLYEATYGGFVLGYLYIRYGFPFAVIAHWGIDYFDTVYSYLGQSAYHIPANAQTVFFLQAAVDIDMMQLMGFASFLLVVYLGLKRLQARSTAPEVHKDEVGGSVFGI